MNRFNILGILFITVGATSLTINLAFDMFMGFSTNIALLDTILTGLFAGMSSLMIIAGVILGRIK